MVISIQGGSGVGKTTVAQQLAYELGGTMFDRGSMLRALTHKGLQQGIALGDEQVLLSMIDATSVRLIDRRVYLDGVDVSDEIRSRRVEENVGRLSQISKVVDHRLDLLIEDGIERLRSFGPVLVTGRGRYPAANLFFHLTIDKVIRAQRRLAQLRVAVTPESIQEMVRWLAQRDSQDKVPAPREGTIVIENNGTIPETVGLMLPHIRP